MSASGDHRYWAPTTSQRSVWDPQGWPECHRGESRLWTGSRGSEPPAEGGRGLRVAWPRVWPSPAFQEPAWRDTLVHKPTGHSAGSREPSQTRDSPRNRKVMESPRLTSAHAFLEHGSPCGLASRGACEPFLTRGRHGGGRCPGRKTTQRGRQRTGSALGRGPGRRAGPPGGREHRLEAAWGRCLQQESSVQCPPHSSGTRLLEPTGTAPAVRPYQHNVTSSIFPRLSSRCRDKNVRPPLRLELSVLILEPSL